MSDKIAINVRCGISRVASGESDRGLSGEMVDGLNSKTLIENPGGQGVLSDGIRVSEESKVLMGESNRGTLGGVIERKPVDSCYSGTNDVSRNRFAETVSSNSSRWESWGVMNMVGRVLDGKLCVDNELEDVDNSENRGEVNQVADVNAQQEVIGEPTSENRIDTNGNDIKIDSVKFDSSRPGEESGLNGNQDSVSCETVPDASLEMEEELNSKAGMLILKARGEHQVMEKEGSYYVSDLVWAKVRSHPWWPGQIFAPSAASDKAAKHLRRASYLIAYFGDQTFAWNEGSKIKPFRMHFSEMEKQSNTDGFSHAVQCALDETARRVEFGLSCPCLAQEFQVQIKFQVVENAGICEGSSRRVGGDSLSSAASFSPADVVQFLESLAGCPQSKPDRLQFTIAKAQLMAYNRWKGHSQLPVFKEYGGLLEDDTRLAVSGPMEGLLPGPVSDVANVFSSKKRKSTARDGSSHKLRHLSGGEESPRVKEKSISDLMSSGSSTLQNNEKKPVRRSDKNAVSSGSMVIASKKRGRKRKSLLSTSTSAESQTMEIIPADITTPDMVLSELILAAKKPTQGHHTMISVVGLLREFRNSICLEKSSSVTVKIDSGECKREQPSDFQTADTFGFQGAEDSYWTDRIIQRYSQDQVLFESQKPTEGGTQLEADVAVVSDLDDNKEKNVIADLDAGNPAAVVNEVSEEYRPTALILNFTNLESIPSVMNLNEIFSRYGPLDISETKILTKSKRAKVIFKRCADAETAFSSTGKFSIFGPALVSYRLHYAPKPRQSRATSVHNGNTNI